MFAKSIAIAADDKGVNVDYVFDHLLFIFSNMYSKTSCSYSVIGTVYPFVYVQ